MEQKTEALGKQIRQLEASNREASNTKGELEVRARSLGQQISVLAEAKKTFQNDQTRLQAERLQLETSKTQTAEALGNLRSQLADAQASVKANYTLARAIVFEDFIRQFRPCFLQYRMARQLNSGLNLTSSGSEDAEAVARATNPCVSEALATMERRGVLSAGDTLRVRQKAEEFATTQIYLNSAYCSAAKALVRSGVREYSDDKSLTHIDDAFNAANKAFDAYQADCEDRLLAWRGTVWQEYRTGECEIDDGIVGSPSDWALWRRARRISPIAVTGTPVLAS